MRNDFLRVRVDGKTRIEARNILEILGMSEGDVVNMLLSQICLHRRVPFDVKLGTRYQGVKKIGDRDSMEFIENIMNEQEPSENVP